MPNAAIRRVAPDRVLPPDQIAAAVARFTDRAHERHNGSAMQEEDERQRVREQTAEQPGEETGLTCPDCGGAIYEQRDGVVVTFRCRVGHQYGSDTFVFEQSKTVENSLWAALRLLEERAVLMRRLEERHEAQERSSRRFGDKAEELEDHAAQLTQLLREITSAPEPDPVTEGS
jgi:two-component system chemotaxis response regulator CheB